MRAPRGRPRRVVTQEGTWVMRLLGVKAPLCATMGPGTVQLGRLGISLAFIGPGPQAVSRSRKLPLCGCVGRPWAEDAGVHRSPPSTLEGPGGATLLLGVLGKERPECVGRGLSGAGRHRASGLWSLMGCWGHRGRGWGGGCNGVSISRGGPRWVAPSQAGAPLPAASPAGSGGVISRGHPHRLGDGAHHSLGSEAWEASAATALQKRVGQLRGTCFSAFFC